MYVYVCVRVCVCARGFARALNAHARTRACTQPWNARFSPFESIRTHRGRSDHLNTFDLGCPCEAAIFAGPSCVFFPPAWHRRVSLHPGTLALSIQTWASHCSAFQFGCPANCCGYETPRTPKTEDRMPAQPPKMKLQKRVGSED